MKRLMLYLLAALLVGGLLFGWGYRRGAASSVSVQIDTIFYERPQPVLVSDRLISVNVPKLIFADISTAADDIPDTAPVNQETIRNDSLHTVSAGSGDSVQITVTERTIEYRDSSYYARVVGPAIGTLGPRLDYFEIYSRTVYKSEQRIWEAGPTVGAMTARPGNVVWAGAFVRRNIGRLRLSAIAAYDTHNGAPMGQVQAEFTLWKK